VLDPRLIRLDEVAKLAKGELNALLGSRVELVVEAPAALACVRADAEQMTRVLTNLALNAREAMPEGGRLVVEFEEVTLDRRYAVGHPPLRPGRYVLMAVTDSGDGMDAEAVRRVFEPYFTTKPLGRGAGLGLSTVYGIVKQSGGFVWVYSEPGIGTTFKIYLPQARPARGAQPLVPPASTDSPTSTVRVLLVDDDDAVRQLIADVLEDQGHQVTSAARPTQALELASAMGPFELLLTDVIMPEMGGRELARRLQARQPDLRVVYVSGYAGEALLQQGNILRGEIFVQKPFSEQALLGSLALALARAR
jgi:CheY-like chemotaxis protein